MKKFIIAFLLFIILLTPVFVQAQTAHTQDALRQQLIQVLMQLVQKLEQQIQQILIQQATQATALNQIVQNTTPVATPPPQPTVCNPNWQCGDWNTCTNSFQTRSCTDTNNCNTETGQPVESQPCVVQIPYTGGVSIIKYSPFPDQTNPKTNEIGDFVVKNESTNESIKITSIVPTVNGNPIPINWIERLSVNQILPAGNGLDVDVWYQNNGVIGVYQSSLTITAIGLLSGQTTTASAVGQTITFK